MFIKVQEYGSEFDWDSTAPYIKDNYINANQCNQNVYGFRSGRDALKAVAKEYNKTHDTVLLPVLCCESMVSPFEMNGYKPVFYKLNDGLTADTKDLRSKLSETSIVIYMSYFGIAPLNEDELKGLKNAYPGAKFVEDRTHTILHKEKDSGFVPDVVVASIRKWFAVADGGLLFIENRLKPDFIQDSVFSDLRKKAMETKSEFLKTGDEEIKKVFRETLNEASALLDASPDAYKITEESAKLLSKIDFERMLLERQRNAQVLKNGLFPLTHTGKLSFVTEFPEKSTIYFPILAKNRDQLQGCLANQGLFCPVIWPIPEQAKNICSNSEYIAENMLAIPCDQRYTQEDMLKIIEIINSVI